VKALVVYYSNSGTTRRVAESIAEAIGGDLEEIVERRQRSPLLDENGKPVAGAGMAVAAMPALLGLGSSIERGRTNPSDYDVVVVGTPVWVGRVVPAVRSYLKRNRKHFASVALFCTCGRAEKLKAIQQMRALARMEPIATMAVTSDDVRNGNYLGSVARFVEGLAQ